MLDRRSLAAGCSLALAAAAWTARGLPALAQPGAYDDGRAIYAALRSQPSTPLSFGDSRIDVVFADGAPGLDRARVLAWVRKSATALTTYFGRYPVQRLDLLIVADDGDRIHSGLTFGFDGSATRVRVGRNAGQDAFDQDWILVHEMVHAALPNVPRESLWVQEGEAVYVEPIARAQAGQIAPEEVWRWSLVGMPKGQPEPDDLGLDHTHSWGRTYWGGAAFWLQADVQIRQRTQGRLGLQAALRTINRESGGNTAFWSVERMMAAGDAATGGHELTTLYAQAKDAPMRIDLPGLFAKLGVAMQGERIIFDDTAPLAALRRQITASPLAS
jgi:hypothetical protein